jgi:CDP-paratose 2-epimerase
MKTILITGGAGFVGSNLAIRLKTRFCEKTKIICLDNLKRRGSELNLSRFKECGIDFQHGDIRNKEDLESVGKVDLILECSAEPSVIAGYGESPAYLVQTNLNGTINCLDFARIHDARFIFLSTSRVYPIKTINELEYVEEETRFELAPGQTQSGVSSKGINEQFLLEGTRSLYGATKLCSEYIIQEYSEMYNIPAVINRCGVLTGPWQMGKVDQGVTALWVARHIFKGELGYFGYGGKGKQVRDILHIEDLFQLICKQIEVIDDCRAEIYNVGGGNDVSISLLELTKICEEVTGNRIKISSVPENRVADIPYYITDNSRITKTIGWTPKIKPFEIVEDIADWINTNKEYLHSLLS